MDDEVNTNVISNFYVFPETFFFISNILVKYIFTKIKMFRVSIV
jgi:hypothetical protein